MECQTDFFLDEVINGFYVPGLMKRAWAAELQLLSFLDEFCEKKVFLTSWTMVHFWGLYDIRALFPGMMTWIFPCIERILEFWKLA